MDTYTWKPLLLWIIGAFLCWPESYCKSFDHPGIEGSAQHGPSFSDDTLDEESSAQGDGDTETFGLANVRCFKCLGGFREGCNTSTMLENPNVYTTVCKSHKCMNISSTGRNWEVTSIYDCDHSTYKHLGSGCWEKHGTRLCLCDTNFCNGPERPHYTSPYPGSFALDEIHESPIGTDRFSTKGLDNQPSNRRYNMNTPRVENDGGQTYTIVPKQGDSSGEIETPKKERPGHDPFYLGPSAISVDKEIGVVVPDTDTAIPDDIRVLNSSQREKFGAAGEAAGRDLCVGDANSAEVKDEGKRNCIGNRSSSSALSSLLLLAVCLILKNALT